MHQSSASDPPHRAYIPRRFIPFPRPPKTGSPVPWLTSVHSTLRGPYGDSRYRGNCDGYLIKDLLRFFKATSVLDPMSGGETCRDVCRELGISCVTSDLTSGFDATDPRSFAGRGTFNFIWVHPPYWQMVKYGDDPRCLANAPTLPAFLDRLRSVFRNCMSVLSEGGKLAVLMGNYSHRGRFLPLTYLTMSLALDEGLWPACTDIVRLQHRNHSAQKTYRSSFIPGLHDVCMVLERAGDAPQLAELKEVSKP